MATTLASTAGVGNIAGVATPISIGATGAALAGHAFSVGLPCTWGNIVVTTSLVLFAFSTLIGWS